MNIFATSPCPIESAEYLRNDFKRLNKMILESAQLICTAGHIKGGFKDIPYKPTHIGHPCRKWVSESCQNGYWLLKHFCALCTIFKELRGKTHKTQNLYEIMSAICYSLPDIPQTPFVNCTDFKDVENVHEAYRLHLAKKWEQDRLKAKLKTIIK